MTASGLKRAQIGLWPLAMAIFFCASGGPFGLETLVKESGPTIAMLLIAVTPILWAAPIALMTAELSSAIPVEGGFYEWVKRAFGPFAGFLCAWWTWLYSWVDVAIYPVQFTDYLGALLRLYGYASPWEDRPWLKWLCGLVVIVPLTWLNIRGAKLVGRTAVVFGLLLLAPFAVMIAVGLPHLHALPPGPRDPSAFRSAFGAGLFVVMWNYLGWDSMSAVAEEVESPRKTFPLALAITVPLVTLCYLLPVWVGLGAYSNPQNWTDGSWPLIAQAIGGRNLALLLAISALIGQAGLFMATLLAASRLPMVLAEDGWLPRALTRIHRRHGTPVVAILVSALVYTVLSYSTFSELVKFDVMLYSAALMLEFAALVWLRYREPALERPFLIPGGKPMLWFVALAPAALVVESAIHGYQTEDQPLKQLLILLIALGSGPLVYGFHRARVRSRIAGE